MESKVNADNFTRDEQQQQLLYLECRAVDNRGYVDVDKMNNSDFAISDKWHDASYIIFNRLKEAHFVGRSTHYVKLSDQAHRDAARFRMERAKRAQISWEALAGSNGKTGVVTL